MLSVLARRRRVPWSVMKWYFTENFSPPVLTHIAGRRHPGIGRRRWGLVVRHYISSMENVFGRVGSGTRSGSRDAGSEFCRG
jgi:hypothetical protein